MLSCFGIDPGATELNGSCALGHISTLGELCRTCLDWKQDPQIPGITQLEASFILVVFPNTSEQPGKIYWLVSSAHPSDKEHYFKCHPSVFWEGGPSGGLGQVQVKGFCVGGLYEQDGITGKCSSELLLWYWFYNRLRLLKDSNSSCFASSGWRFF